MDLVALITILAAVCTGVWTFGRTIEPPGLAELFRTSHELGWPVGVQEEDTPPAFGSRFRPTTQPPNATRELAEDGIDPDGQTLDESTAVPASATAAGARDRAWSARVHDVRLVAGTARR